MSTPIFDQLVKEALEKPVPPQAIVEYWLGEEYQAPKEITLNMGEDRVITITATVVTDPEGITAIEAYEDKLQRRYDTEDAVEDTTDH